MTLHSRKIVVVSVVLLLAATVWATWALDAWWIFNPDGELELITID